MSRRIELRVTPLSRPDLFTVIKPSEVKLGNIYQGKKNRRKWYQNTTGQACVESDRTYYRPNAPAMNALGITMPKLGERLDGTIKKPDPVAHQPAEQEEHEQPQRQVRSDENVVSGPMAVSGENVPILTMTWSLNMAGLKRLIDEARKLDLS